MKVAGITLIVFGVLLMLVGILFKIMHWPDLFKGIYSGPIMFALGLIFITINRSKKQ